MREKTRKIILASGSPRRKELLTMMGLDFEVIPSKFDEWLDDAQTPRDVAIALWRGKVHEVAARFPQAIVIAGDTIVTIDGKQLGKAADDDEARNMLKLCASATNLVTSSVVIVCEAEHFEYADAGETTVYFKPFDKAAVDRYIATGDYRDKAGAWGIQTGAAPLIDHYDGDLETIVGLPTRLLVAPLAELGVTAHPAGYTITS